MKNQIIAVLAFCSVVGYAHADEYPYIGVGYSSINSDFDLGALGTYSVHNSMVGLVVGYQFTPSLAIEARGYGSASDDEILGVEVEVDRQISVLAKGMVPIGEYIKLYATLGYANLKLSASIPGYTVSESDSDIKYGTGLAIHKGGPLELQVEWMNIYDAQGIEATSFNINLVHKL